MPKKKVLPKFLTDLEALELVWGPPETILAESDLRGYQHWMVDKIKELPGILLAAEMGLGKTGAVLKAVADMLAEGTVRKVLVIAPLRVAENTWPEEIAKWEFSRHLTYRIVTGTGTERMASFHATGPVDVTIINRENLRWLMEVIGVRKWPFDVIVYDEASRLKGGRKRVKAKEKGEKGNLTELGVIERLRNKTKKFIALTGTPAPNGLIDLWGPVYAVDKGQRLGTSISAYKKRWFNENRYSYKVEPLAGSEADIMDRIKDVFFSLREEDYLDLPPLIERDHLIKLPASVMARYRKFEREMALQVLNRWKEPETIEAVNRGVLTGKLLQFANGSLYENAKYDEDTEQWLPRHAVEVHQEKLKVLDSIINEAAGRPVLLAYSFQFDKQAILKRFPQCRVFGESPSDKRDWDAGRIPILLMHPASAGHGLNFQHGSNIAVWYGLTWSSELYQQFLKRLHRSGQKADRVFLHRIISVGTADEDILPVLRDRKSTEDRLKSAVKARLERAASGE